MARRRSVSGSVRVVVLADTHLRSQTAGGRGRVRALPDEAAGYLHGADAILHAGDVLDSGVLAQLSRYAPLHAVLGNNDASLIGALPLTRIVDIGGVQIGMIHDSGRSSGRALRLRRRFPDADVVVFGHSHAPVNEWSPSGQLLFNPGSPTQRRSQPCHTLGELRIAGGKVIEHRVVALD
jgi:putative phosphoesterase